MTFSEKLACPECGRDFKPLEPRQFSFNSPLGWCAACDGLGTRTGVDHAALVGDPTKSLGAGALDLWPALDRKDSRAASQAMLEALNSASPAVNQNRAARFPFCRSV